jgi:hypothetical protein
MTERDPWQELEDQKTVTQQYRNENRELAERCERLEKENEATA